MASTTTLIGGLMIVLGLAGYFGTGMVSITALIPAFFGLVFVVLGVVARNESARRHAMHGAAALALLGFLATARSLAALPDALSGASARPAAVYSQAAFAVLSAILLALAVRSFIAARRARRT